MTLERWRHLTERPLPFVAALFLVAYAWEVIGDLHGPGGIATLGIATLGIATLGIVTATLASWIVEHMAQTGHDSRAATRGQIKALSAQFDELRALLERTAS